MKIGYSFWGFLGDGITDTPDGGRSHRRTLVNGLASRGHDLVFLQPDRDLIEAGVDLSAYYRWDAGLPDLDVLFLEWRWPIPGRNTTWCGAAGHTCDLHRQAELLSHYTEQLGVPTILWDKDRQLPHDDPLSNHPAVTLCEAALHPSPGAVSLFFPVDDQVLDTADPSALSQLDRPTTLAYVGNQYDRDDAFNEYFAPAAAEVPHVVAGKWPDTRAWPQLNFVGRVPFRRVGAIHRSSVATVLLLPERYARVGQVTQRIFEAVLAGCLPIMPADVRSADQFVPSELITADGHEVARLAQHLRGVTGTAEHAELIDACLKKLAPFRLSRQLEVIANALLRRVVSAT
ncbi:CgeB family protein [Salinispora mooreana]|uniref:hypothetical protein n=1 Tax=Salinispora mooreana TaxID=999545 RepID=UPI0003694A06|nr:hypothetical protein [Salinispora mooreana]